MPTFNSLTRVVTLAASMGLAASGLLARKLPHTRCCAGGSPGCAQWAFSGPTEIMSNGRAIVTFDANGPNINTSATANNLSDIPINGFVDANNFVDITVTMPDRERARHRDLCRRCR